MFGISLRLSAASVNALAGSPDKRAELKAYLSDNDMCLYTVNAFPYGPFKNIIVKEQVYEPDWSTEERLQYKIKARGGGSPTPPRSIGKRGPRNQGGQGNDVRARRNYDQPNS